MRERAKPAQRQLARRSPAVVRLPGFVNDDVVVGLGDAIGRATSYIGIKRCGGCERRAAALNRWIAFSGRRTK